MTVKFAASFKKYMVPALVFQGVLIGGGYGTGREIVEYFMQYGPLGGILGMLLITLVLWSIILAVTFEFSRKFKDFDYRSLLKDLLGPLWVSFEFFYIALLVIVLAVIGSAAGILLRDFFSIPYIVGVGIMLASVGYLTFKGSGLIEKFLSAWSVLIYIVYGLFLIVALVKFGPLIQKNLFNGQHNQFDRQRIRIDELGHFLYLFRALDDRGFVQDTQKMIHPSDSGSRLCLNLNCV